MKDYGGCDYYSDMDDFIHLHKPYQIGDKVNNNDIAKTKSHPAVISYAHINITDKNYGFGQSDFSDKDAFYYLSRVKLLSLKSIISIKDEENSQDWHLNPTRGKNIISALKKHFNITKYIVTPDIFHFALYPKEDQVDSNREKRIKNPRIHFIIGANGIIYPIFYDPYHEINPQ